MFFLFVQRAITTKFPATHDNRSEESRVVSVQRIQDDLFKMAER